MMVKKMLKQKIFISFLFVSISLIGLTACIPRKPTTDDIVGLWVQGTSEQIPSEGNICAYFEFFSDGKFVARNIPLNYLFGRNPSLVNLQGTWYLDPSPKDLFGYNKINIETEYIQSQLFVWVSNFEIYFYAGYEDEPYFFTKVEKLDCKQ